MPILAVLRYIRQRLVPFPIGALQQKSAKVWIFAACYGHYLSNVA